MPSWTTLNLLHKEKKPNLAVKNYKKVKRSELVVNLNTAYRREQGPIVIPAEPKKEPPKQGYSVYGSPDINYSALYTSQPPKNGLAGKKNKIRLPHVPLLQPTKSRFSPKDLASSGRENPYLAFQRYNRIDLGVCQN